MTEESPIDIEKELKAAQQLPIENLEEDLKAAQLSPIEELKAAQQLPIKNLVFSGGGAKGTLYVGAVRAILETGMYDNVNTVAGSSAGSMIAALLATGIDSNSLGTQLNDVNFKALLGKSEGSLPINKDGKPLYNFISNGIKSSILSTLEKSDKEKTEEIERIIEECKKSDGKITFGHLKTLQEFDQVKFKDLKVTAVEQGTGKMQVFDYQTHPNVEIALACRASASIPILLQPVEIDGKKYIDGGYFDNLPTKHLDDNDKVKGKANKIATLVFAFGEGKDAENPVFNALYSNKEKLYNAGKLEQFKRDYIPKKFGDIGGDYKNTGQKELGYKKLQEEFPMRTIELRAGDIKTTDFDKAQTHAKQMEQQGYCDTKGFLINHDLIKQTKEQITQHNYEKFFLEAFKKFEKSEKWYSSNSNNPNVSVKAKELLSYADSRNYGDRDTQSLVKEYIKTAAYSRGNDKLSINTTAITTLINTLNSVDTPQSIKQDFAKALGPICEKNIEKPKFKFTKEDFNLLIIENQLSHSKDAVKLRQEKGMINDKIPVSQKKSSSGFLSM